MTDSLSFSGSADLDNGWAVTYNQAIDGGAAAGNTDIVVNMGDMGTYTFVKQGSSGPVSSWDDKTPSANEESWGTAIVGTADGPTNAAIGTNGFIYDYTVSDAIAIKAAYEPSRGTTQVDSSTEIGVAYTGIDGLTIGAATGENNAAAASLDISNMYVKYAADAFTVGYQTSESDSEVQALS